MPTTELEPAPTVDLALMPRADTAAIFAAFEQQAAALLTRADSIKVTSIDQKNEMAEARRVRLSLREIRITMEKRRVEMVEDMTKETKRINSTAKQVRDAIDAREEYLQLQEQFAERWQRAEVEAERRQRDAEVVELRRQADELRTKEAPPVMAPDLVVTHVSSFVPATAPATRPASRFTLDDKIAVLGRELGMRRRVYPQRVADGQMMQEQATFQTEVMAEILAEYHAQKAAAEPGLFAGQ